MTLDATTRGTKPRLTADATHYARIVGRNVARLRNRRGLTQEQLAEEISKAGWRVSSSVISFIEKGRAGRNPSHQHRNVSVDQLMAFAAFFECEPADLLHPACRACDGCPPAGFTCNTCGAAQLLSP